jgi:two-component system sensor histidine kinase/response regulator
MSTILLIDDEPGFRAVMFELLRREGHTVLEAENGRAGIRQHLDHAPDLILCDLLMPEMDGQEAIRAIRCLSPDAKIIAMTGSLEDENVRLRTAEILGANEILEKPFSVRKLLCAIYRVSAQAPRPARNCDFADAVG